jgi:hypothetical protein
MTEFSDDQNSPTPNTASEMPVILLVDDNASTFKCCIKPWMARVTDY